MKCWSTMRKGWKIKTIYVHIQDKYRIEGHNDHKIKKKKEKEVTGL